MLALIAACSGMVEQRTITEGSYDGLQIGQSKHDAFMRAQALGARFIRSTQCGGFLLSREGLGLWSSLDDFDGLELEEPSGRTEVDFSRGRVSRVADSAHGSLAPKLGESTAEVRDQLRSLLATRRDLTVRPVLRGVEGEVVNLSHLTEADERLVRVCNTWDFEIPSIKPAGAYYTLTFDSSGLKSIAYRRPRVRVD
ncbi:MAG TPA: hypothetical protein VGM84_10345 [Steroidobacteraceae bacterium]|jgi:hypothetical protein